MNFDDLKSEKGIKQFNSYISDRSYVEGFQPTQADVAVFEALGKAPGESFPHALRWYNHIKSFDLQSLPGEKKPLVQRAAPADKKPAQTTAPAKKDDDDDDIDLFGSDEEDEEAAKIREDRLKAYNEKKSKKPAVIAKSSIVIDVKPWSDETEMDKMEECVRSIEMPGLVWGASKLVPVGYGINKLQVMCVVEDEKVSVDELVEKIQDFEDHVQSVDIAAFNKI